MPRSRAWYVQAFGAGLLVLALLSGVLWFINPYTHVANSGEVDRNPLFRRGWSAYTAAPQSPGEIVLITHSQGYAPELDAADTYPVLLQAMLDDAYGAGVFTVHNWSAPGSQSVETQILLLRAIGRRPQVIVWLADSIALGDRANAQRLALTDTDIKLLLADPAVLTGLATDVVAEKIGAEELATDLTTSLIPLIQYRGRFWDWMEYTVELDYPLVHGAGFYGRRTYAYEKPPRTTCEEVHAGWNLPLGDNGPVPAIYREFEHVVKRMAAGTRLLFAFAPQCPYVYGDIAERAFARYVEGAAAFAPADRMLARNYALAIPTEHFLSAQHFDEAGHRTLADLLFRDLQLLLE